MTNLAFEPIVSTPLWTTLAVVGALLLGWYAWSRPEAVPRGRWAIVVGLTGLAGATVLFVLLNPTWLSPIPPPAGKPRLTLLVDRSASMATEDGPGAATRYDAALEIARQVEQETADRFDVQIRAFDESVTTETLDSLAAQTPGGRGTDLASAIGASIDYDAPAGQALLVLADGIHNTTRNSEPVLEAAETARAMSVPVFVTPVGTEATPDDVELVLTTTRELTYVGQPARVEVGLVQRGENWDGCRVVVLDGDDVVEQRDVELVQNGRTRASFEIPSDRTGAFQYEIRLEPLEGETTDGNNSATVEVRVVDEPLRVVVLEGKPFWDAKFLVRTLAEDPSLEVDVAVRLAAGRILVRSIERGTPTSPNNEQPDQDMPADDAPAVPSVRTESSRVLRTADELLDEKTLASTQVVVLGRDSDVFLDPVVAERLRSWVANSGGSLVCARGAPMARVDERLARLLPVDWTPAVEERFRVELTDRGRRIGWFGESADEGGSVLDRLPTIATSTAIRSPKPLATVLASSADENPIPVVTYQQYGLGRVVVVEGAGMWRWAFLAPRYRELDNVYGRVWQGLMRWLSTGTGLAPGRYVALRSDRSSYRTGEPAMAMLLSRNEFEVGTVPEVELKGSDGTRTFAPVSVGDEPGVYRVVFGALPEGRYVASLKGLEDVPAADVTTTFSVRDLDEERLDLRVRTDLLVRVAETTGGSLVMADDPASVAERFDEQLRRSRLVRYRRTSAWDRWWLLVAVFGMWSVVWSLRRASGIV